MCTVVNRKTDGNYIVDNCYAVKCDVPVIEESQQHEVHQWDAEEDEQGHWDVGGHHQHDYQDRHQGKANILYSLFFEDNVCFIVQESLLESVGITDVGTIANSFEVFEELHSFVRRVLDVNTRDILSES